MLVQELGAGAHRRNPVRATPRRARAISVAKTNVRTGQKSGQGTLIGRSALRACYPRMLGPLQESIRGLIADSGAQLRRVDRARTWRAIRKVRITLYLATLS